MSDNDTVIRIEGIGKRYKLGETFDTARNFRETLMSLPRHFSRKARAAADAAARRLKAREEARRAAAPSHALDPRQEGGHFWALRDIHLEIKRGQAVGIIGRNGAGKSTLLKILSRITKPTEGYAEIHGRVGALLEVGTGMHPELTGRENIYLNGAIIGMTKAEIDAKFDQIVDFAGTEAFLDTPLKRYSSGMRVRLGFSVAAHLEPEVLIVDEVLSVGDAEFRKKCLGKMDDVTQEGRTVLFVSHNLGAVRRLCSQAVMLQGGRIALVADSDRVVSEYTRSASQRGLGQPLSPDDHLVYPPDFEVQSVSLRDRNERPTNTIRVFEEYSIVIVCKARASSRDIHIGVVVTSADGTLVFTLSTYKHLPMPEGTGGREFAIRTWLTNFLSPGEYVVTLRVKRATELVDEIECGAFSVAPISVSGDEESWRKGLCQVSPRWELAEGNIS